MNYEEFHKKITMYVDVVTDQYMKRYNDESIHAKAGYKYGTMIGLAWRFIERNRLETKFEEFINEVTEKEVKDETV